MICDYGYNKQERFRTQRRGWDEAIFDLEASAWDFGEMWQCYLGLGIFFTEMQILDLTNFNVSFDFISKLAVINRLRWLTYHNTQVRSTWRLAQLTWLSIQTTAMLAKIASNFEWILASNHSTIKARNQRMRSSFADKTGKECVRKNEWAFLIEEKVLVNTDW